MPMFNNELTEHLEDLKHSSRTDKRTLSGNLTERVMCENKKYVNIEKCVHIEFRGCYCIRTLTRNS